MLFLNLSEKPRASGVSCWRTCVLLVAVMFVGFIVAISAIVIHVSGQPRPRQPAPRTSTPDTPFARQSPWPLFTRDELVGKAADGRSVVAVDLDRNGTRDLVVLQEEECLAFTRRGDKWTRRILGPHSDVLVAGKQLALPARSRLSVTLEPPRRTIPLDAPAMKVRPGTTAAGDVNGDGRSDFVLSGYDGEYGVILSGGPGGYRARLDKVPAHIQDVAIQGGKILLATDQGVFHAGQKLPALGRPQVWRWGDLDGDKVVDFVALGDQNEGFWVSAPLGKSPVRHDLPEYSMVSPSAIADLDGDGWNDILAMGAGNTVVLRNEGGGKFSRQRADTRHSVPQYAGDLDGDGHPEIAVIDAEGNLRVLYVKRVLVEDAP